MTPLPVRWTPTARNMVPPEAFHLIHILLREVEHKTGAPGKLLTGALKNCYFLKRTPIENETYAIVYSVDAAQIVVLSVWSDNAPEESIDLVSLAQKLFKLRLIQE